MSIKYTGTGESIDDPVRIFGVQNELSMIEAEVNYITQSIGVRGVHWKLRFRSEHIIKGRVIDEVGISAHCGHITSIFFTLDDLRQKKDQL